MIQLKNYMEEIVFDFLDELLEDSEICDCEKCRMDIAALALNELPPLYFVTKKGEVFSKTNSLKNQFEVDVIAALSRASVIVKKRPHH